MSVLRGQVYMADLGHGIKPWVIVSNNGRNLHLGSVLAVRVTTTPKPQLPSIVQLQHGEPLVGYVLADDIAEIFHDELGVAKGALSPHAMLAVDEALRAALKL